MIFVLSGIEVIFFVFNLIDCFFLEFYCIMPVGVTLILNFMKKILYFLAVALMVIGLTACFGKKDVAKFTISLNDKDGPTVLTLTPDYSKRTFAVDYKKDFFDKKQKSVAFTGQMGGESFDSFETLTKMVKNYTAPALKSSEVPSKVVSLIKAVVEGTDKTLSTMEVAEDDSSKDVQDLKSFYNDIVKLLIVPAPV